MNHFLILIFFLLFVRGNFASEAGPQWLQARSFLVNSVYWSPIISLEERKELVQADSILVLASGLLRYPKDFLFTVETEGSALSDLVEYLYENYSSSIGPNQLVLVIVRRDSIERFYLKKDLSAERARDLKGSLLIPGDLVLLGLR